MNKHKGWLPLLLILLLLAASAGAEQAADLTAGLTVSVVDKPGKTACITDGKYTTYWESSEGKNPYVVLTSDRPVYGLYLCFRRLPESYEIQTKKGENWETVAEGDNRYHHAFYELDGLTSIRIYATAEKKCTLGFNVIFAFGPGEVPDWVQRWDPPAEKADLMVLVAHPDDELLFTGGAIPVYGAERQKQVEVVYLTPSNPTRRSEALNGLWAMGVRNYPVFGPFSDKYAKTGKLKDAYKEAGGKNTVLEWLTGVIRRFKPEVLVTHAENGEYGHPQHKMMADAAKECFSLAADSTQYPESADQYGAWQIKKLYLHLYGSEEEQTVLDWNQPLSAFGGKTGAELASEAFALHVSQKGMGTGKGKKFVEFTVEETGAKMYPYDHFGLQNSTVGPDEQKNDFLEHLDGGIPAVPADPGEEETEPEEPGTGPAETPEDPEESEGGTEEPSEEPQKAGQEETAGLSAEDDLEEEVIDEGPTADSAEPSETAADGTGADPTASTAPGTDSDIIPMTRFKDVTPPEWADVTLNDQGFLDEGEYVLEDPENGHWMYVSKTLRIQITREYLAFEKAQKKDPDQAFYCFVSHIWCDYPAGELPHTVYSNPDKPRTDPDFIKNIGRNQKVVLAISTDYYTYRAGRARSDKGYHVGIVIRNGEILYDDPEPKKKQMPNFETLALYRDGHVESHPSKDMGAEEYLANGATDVYTFGPCLVRDGRFTDYIAEANRVNNPRHAFGMVEPGHYVDVICEGRVRKSATMKRSTGVMMENLAQIMINEGCTVAVNLDGGQTAVCAFMGKQLNRVVRTDPNGRPEVEVLAFGTSDRIGTEADAE